MKRQNHFHSHLSVHVIVYRYVLLLNEVVKNTPASHPDSACLKMAMVKVKEIAMEINREVREHMNRRKLYDLR